MVNTRLSEDDGPLLERVQQGDKKAIASLYDRHASVVYTIALRVLHDPALAEQILSDIFLEVWRSPERFMKHRGGLCFSLAILARNRAVEKRLRKMESDFDLASAACADRGPRLNWKQSLS